MLPFCHKADIAWSEFCHQCFGSPTLFFTQGRHSLLSPLPSNLLPLCWIHTDSISPVWIKTHLSFQLSPSLSSPKEPNFLKVESSLPHLSVLVGSRNFTTFLKCLNRQSPPACHWFFLPYFTGHFCCVEHHCPFLFLKLLFPHLSRCWTFPALLIPPWPGLKDARFSVHHLKIPFLAPLRIFL